MPKRWQRHVRSSARRHTADLNAAAEEVLQKHGAYSPFKNYPDHTRIRPALCISVNEELVHGIPGKRKLKEGDIVSVDCGTVYEGFVAIRHSQPGLARSRQKPANVGSDRKALYEGIAQMVAGKPYRRYFCSDPSSMWRKPGLHVTREYTGHGVGRQMHEGPQVPNYGVPWQRECCCETG